MSGITGDLAGLGQLASNLRKLAEVPSRASKEAAEGVAAAIEVQFAEGIDPYGNPWAELAQSTLDKGRFPPPLTDTEKHGPGMGVKVSAKRGAGVSITFDAPYAGFHHTGTKDMPARKVLPVGVMPATWNAAIRDALEDGLGKLGNGVP